MDPGILCKMRQKVVLLEQSSPGLDGDGGTSYDRPRYQRGIICAQNREMILLVLRGFG